MHYEIVRLHALDYLAQTLPEGQRQRVSILDYAVLNKYKYQIAHLVLPQDLKCLDVFCGEKAISTTWRGELKRSLMAS